MRRLGGGASSSSEYSSTYSTGRALGFGLALALGFGAASCGLFFSPGRASASLFFWNYWLIFPNILSDFLLDFLGGSGGLWLYGNFLNFSHFFLLGRD